MTEQSNNQWLPEELPADEIGQAQGMGETRPEPEKTNASEKAKKPSEKPAPRYVGRVTLGVVMILLGLLITSVLLVPGWNWLWLMKLAPLILVLLGGEILVASIRQGDRQIKVGFGMTLLCLILIFGSIGAAMLPDLWDTFGPPAQEQIMVQAKEKQSAVYAQIDPTSVRRLSITTDGLFTEQDHRWYAHATLTNPVEGKTAFAQAAWPLVQAMAEQQVDEFFLAGENKNQTESYHLTLDNVSAFAEVGPEGLEKLVEWNVR